ncbi:MAG TPA: TetR/AcrR family transcriptional regulator [Gemmatimonadaceae bacterium]|nr:TetR/AcrR family transcriptional regulator [Gemmatimonadaceae bacterium]
MEGMAMSPAARGARGGAEVGGIRERILHAAMAILREEGIQGLSQVRVARRAQVRQSHLTYYFPKRHDLVEAVAVRFADGVAHGIGETAAGPAAGAPAAVLERIAAAIADHGHMRMFAGVIVEADGDPELRAVVARATLRVQSMVAELLGGEDAMERAARFLAAAWGAGLYDFILRKTRGSTSPRSLLAATLDAGAPRARRSR